MRVLPFFARKRQRLGDGDQVLLDGQAAEDRGLLREVAHAEGARACTSAGW